MEICFPTYVVPSYAHSDEYSQYIALLLNGKMRKGRAADSGAYSVPDGHCVLYRLVSALIVEM